MNIQRFLCELGAHEKPHSFKIIAATDSSASQSQDYFTSLLTGLVKDLNKGGIRRLEFHGLDKRQFSSQVHDRFIRFNRTVCTLGRGIEVLSGYSVKKLSDFSMKTNPKTVDEYRKVEEALETKAQCSVIYDADQVA